MNELEQLQLEYHKQEKQLIVERRRLLQSQLMVLDYQEREIEQVIFNLEGKRDYSDHPYQPHDKE